MNEAYLFKYFMGVRRHTCRRNIPWEDFIWNAVDIRRVPLQVPVPLKYLLFDTGITYFSRNYQYIFGYRQVYRKRQNYIHFYNNISIYIFIIRLTTSSRLRGVVGCRWYRTGHAGNQSGRPMFSSGQQQTDMIWTSPNLYLIEFLKNE